MAADMAADPVTAGRPGASAGDIRGTFAHVVLATTIAFAPGDPFVTETSGGAGLAPPD